MNPGKNLVWDVKWATYKSVQNSIIASTPLSNPELDFVYDPLIHVLKTIPFDLYIGVWGREANETR